ncbi:MAG: phenylalanine--tRNA ligase subunit alpha [Chthoniobacterales bacterium]
MKSAFLFAMEDQIQALQTEALAAIETAADAPSLEGVRVKYLGKTGSISLLSDGMRNVSKEDRPRIGKALNELRNSVTQALQDKTSAMEGAREAASLSEVDTSLPGTSSSLGSIHPLTLLQERAVKIFRRLGFAIADGPDIETEWHNFDALNTPPDHPARNDQDTFYLPDGRLLRAHTSTIQIRTMESQPPPIRVIAPGAAYRRDEVDATHLAQFNQMEGLVVGEGIALTDLKGTLEFFFRELFGNDAQLRFRPHFFPFTEPSFEIDIRAEAMGGEWMELAGCGMVDPAVFEAINKRRGDNAYDPEKITGFAFGFGLDRLAMNLCSIPDVRMLTENDLRFLKQF